MIDLLQLESNRFAIQLGRTRIKSITNPEIRAVIGILFYMSVVHLPTRRMYWSQLTRQDSVADVMTINRFEEILSVLHANDNELLKKQGEPGYDRLHKVRPLLTMINAQFKRNAEPEKCVSVDEQIIPFKGRHSMKVYMSKKPKKWGYKNWVLAGQSGYVHRFYLAGDNTVPPSDAVQSVGKSGDVVVILVEGQPRHTYVFFDNYFASPALLLELKKQEIYGTCTMRKNRTNKCPLLTEKEMKKKDRGYTDHMVSSETDVLVCQWLDNKVVSVASNIHSVNPTHMVKRYNRKEKRHIEVSCPHLIQQYNRNMGGVDKCDMLMSLYRNAMKSNKWYKRIMFHLFDLCVVNAWLLYRASRGATICLAQFKLDIAHALLKFEEPGEHDVVPQRGNGRNAVFAQLVNADARYDRVGHFPQNIETSFAQRCKLEECKRRCKYVCRKCGVYLCVDKKSDCFFKFHHH